MFRFHICERIDSYVILPTICYDSDYKFLYISWLKWEFGIMKYEGDEK